MGIAGELVKNVFSKTRSTKTQESNVRNAIGVDKKRWSSVRAYLCGEEFNSVVAEEDSASIKSSNATVNQSFQAWQDTEENQSNDTNNEDQDISSKPLHEEAAAVIIQSAFRGFMVRYQMNAVKFRSYEKEPLIDNESPGRESMATSIEVQTGNSTISIQHEATSNSVQHKTKTQVFKPKEDWDDSTVDSSISKIRMKNRLEAMTRREKALAYAFSQQLRICSKRKQTKCDGIEDNMGSSWMERWMATRVPESYPAEDCMSRQHETVAIGNKSFIRKKILDLSFDGKESCGSNEVPVPNDASGITTQEEKDSCKRSAKNKIQGTKHILRSRISPPQHQSQENPKGSKKDGTKEAAKEKRHKINHTDRVRKDTSSQRSPESVTCESLKSGP